MTLPRPLTTVLVVTLPSTMALKFSQSPKLTELQTLQTLTTMAVTRLIVVGQRLTTPSWQPEGR